MLNCNGKCILAQKIKKAQEQEDEPKNITQKFDISFFFNKCPQFEIKNIFTDLRVALNPFIILNYSKGHLQGVFHPPQV